MSEQPDVASAAQELFGETGGGGTGDTPYSQYLEQFKDPASRQIAENVFKEWDGNTTQRFQKLHSDYQSKYSAIDPLLNDYDPADIQAAVTIAEQLQQDPTAFLQLLQQNLGDEGGGYEEEGTYPETSDDPYDQRFGQLEETLASVMEQLQQQTAQQEQAQNDRQLNDTLKALAQEHGDFDEDVVLAKALKNGGDLEAAVQEYKALEEQIRTRGNRPSPRPLGAGGGVPSNAFDPNSMSSRDTRDLVRKILDESNSQ
jgi:hypothetical protein